MEMKAADERTDSPRSDADVEDESKPTRDMMKSYVAPVLHRGLCPATLSVACVCVCQCTCLWLCGCVLVFACFTLLHGRSFKVTRNKGSPPDTVLCARCHAIISELNDMTEEEEAADGAV